MLKFIESVSEPGTKNTLNEDIIIVTENVCIILDGATGLGDTDLFYPKSDATWFVEIFKKYFLSLYHSDLSIITCVQNTLKKIESTYKEIVKELPIHKYNYPSASMIAVEYIEHGLVNFYRLGDCNAYIKTSTQEINVFGKSNLYHLDLHSINELNACLLAGYTQAEALKKIKPILKKHRTMMNSDDGYWILSIIHSNIFAITEHIEKQTIQLQDGEQIVLASDGLSSYVDLYNFSSMFDDGLLNILQRIRKIENKDKMMRAYPRLKISDDATGILLKYIK